MLYKFRVGFIKNNKTGVVRKSIYYNSLTLIKLQTD